MISEALLPVIWDAWTGIEPEIIMDVLVGLDEVLLVILY